MGEPNFEMLIQKDVENMENMAFYATEKPKNNENEEDAQEVALETKEENVLKQYLADHTSGQIYLGALSVVGLYVVFKMMKLGK